jgi:hypothetical protein
VKIIDFEENCLSATHKYSTCGLRWFSRTARVRGSRARAFERRVKNSRTYNLSTVASIKTGTFGQLDLFDHKLMQLNFDPGVENRISV